MAKELSSHDKKRMKKEEKEKLREEQRNSALTSNTKKSVFKYILYGILIIAAGFGLFALANRAPNVATTEFDNELLNINLREHSNLALHIHPTIEFEILGKRSLPPSNIGITSEGMRVIHTHENDGVVHIETPYPAQLYLRDFFTMWNKTFTSECIFEYCTNETHEMKMYVNGVLNTEYGDLTLYDRDAIKIEYSAKEQ